MIHWDEKYSVGVHSIDLQHQEIFRLINKLLDALKKGEALQVIYPIILELERYASIHFQKEEFFFQRFNYPETSEHIREHRDFIQQVTAFKTDCKAGNLTVSIKMLNFLNEWIQHHILEIDQKYSKCFLENGLK